MHLAYHIVNPEQPEWCSPASGSALLLILDGEAQQVGGAAPFTGPAVDLVPAAGRVTLRAVRGLAFVPPTSPSGSFPRTLPALSAALVWEIFFEQRDEAFRQAALPLLACLAGAPNTETPAPSLDPVNRALASMNDDLGRPWRLADLATAAGVTPRRLTYLFGKQLGRPPMLVLSEKRLARAKVLLEQTSLPVGEIAATLGYGNLSAFSHAFSRQQGLSPRAYREQLRWLL